MMNNTSLTLEDISDLMDALEVWPTKGQTGEMMGDLIESLFQNDLSPENQAKIKAKRAQAKFQRENEAKRMRERSIMLQAKLIQARQMILSEGQRATFAALNSSDSPQLGGKEVKKA
jgi:hypothetical protein